MDDKENAFEFLFYEKTRSVLWQGNRNFIAVAPIQKYEFLTQLAVDEEQVCFYDPCSIIWGFFPGIDSANSGVFDVAFETLDHQLDFNTMEAKDFDPADFNPTVNQMRDIVKREGFDGKPILEVNVVFQADQTCFALALLKGNRLDFYWNKARLGTSMDRNRVEQIAFTENYFFYRRKQETNFQRVDLSIGA